MKPELLIRTDGSSEIGLGHLVRCISLSHMLAEQYRITFVCREIPESSRREILQTGAGLKQIREEDSFFDLLSPGATVVLDGYSFDTDFQKRVKKAGCTLVCIDDLSGIRFYADLVINHAPGILRDDYRAEPYTRFALGPDYALLRPAFLDQARKKDRFRKPGTVLICFGGADIGNRTLTAAKTAAHFNEFKKIIIITGSAYRYEEELKNETKGQERFELYRSVGEKTMLALMKNAGVAIVPASGILFEVFATGAIPVSGICTENQKRVYEGFKKFEAFSDAGTFSEDEISRALTNLDDVQPKKIIDGKSPGRIQTLFQHLQGTNTTFTP